MRILIYFVVILFSNSLFLKVLVGTNNVYGFMALAFGWVAIFSGHWLAFGAWSANVLLMYSLVSKKVTFVQRTFLSGIASLFSLFALGIDSLLLVHNTESYSKVALGLGGYLWIAGVWGTFICFLFQQQKIKTLTAR